MAGNLTVAVRVRPLSDKERTRGAFSCLVCQDGKQINAADPDDKMGGIDYLRLDRTKDKSYAFDHAFDENVGQLEVFDGTANRVIEDVSSGGNACVFAYGATGSGKTFTMMGTAEAPGVVLLTADALFARASADDERKIVVTMQYIEIYNEVVQDLLEPSNSALDVREAPGKGTFVAGASRLSVSSRSELESLIHKGNLYRTTEATNVNEVSSRSHAVLQLHVETASRFDGQAGMVRVGKLSLIDLAGSERAAKTGNMGKRLHEGANINRSLLTLANCINALADKTKRHGHVPYRDSKLTRLLKDSLGGPCKTVMITNVSPASDQFEETLNSLKYANRAKNIRTKDVTVTVHRVQPAEIQLQMVRKLRESFGQLAVSPDEQLLSPHSNASAPHAAAEPGASGRRPWTAAPRVPGKLQVGVEGGGPPRQRGSKGGTAAHGGGGRAGGGRSSGAKSGGRGGGAVLRERSVSVPLASSSGSKGQAYRPPPARSEADEVPYEALSDDALNKGAGGGDEMHAHGQRHQRISRTSARLWQSITQNTAWAEAHAVLDQLEREAVEELQMDLAGLLAERSHLLEERMVQRMEQWRAHLQSASVSEEASGGILGSSLEKLFSSREVPPAAPTPSSEEEEQVRHALAHNRRSLRKAREAFLAGLPSDERSESAGILWENAVLRAEADAGRLALSQVHSQLEDLTAACKAGRWSGQQLVPLLEGLGSSAAARAAELAEGLNQVVIDKPAGDHGAADQSDLPTENSAGGRPRFLAQMVLSMMQHSATRFGQVLRDTQEMTTRHHRERMDLCANLQLVQLIPDEAQGPRLHPFGAHQSAATPSAAPQSTPYRDQGCAAEEHDDARHGDDRGPRQGVADCVSLRMPSESSGLNELRAYIRENHLDISTSGAGRTKEAILVDIREAFSAVNHQHEHESQSAAQGPSSDSGVSLRGAGDGVVPLSVGGWLAEEKAPERSPNRKGPQREGSLEKMLRGVSQRLHFTGTSRREPASSSASVPPTPPPTAPWIDFRRWATNSFSSSPPRGGGTASPQKLWPPLPGSAS